MKLVEFLLQIGKLKRIKRAGWIRHGIPDPESVADHSFRIALLAMLLAPKLKIDQLKAIKMALIHDIGEAEVGDIIKRIGEKEVGNIADLKAKELAAVKKLTSLITDEEIVTLYKEYSEAVSPVGSFVKQLDKLERVLQAYEYETITGKDLEEFFISDRPLIHDPAIQEILQEIEKLRK